MTQQPLGYNSFAAPLVYWVHLMCCYHGPLEFADGSNQTMINWELYFTKPVLIQPKVFRLYQNRFSKVNLSGCPCMS